MEAVTIPVMAKARIGHFVEAQVLEALGVDYIDESEVLTPADEVNHIDKHDFKVPFVCGCRDLGEALRRINEGAAMIRTKGEAGTGNIVEAVRHIRALQSGIRASRPCATTSCSSRPRSSRRRTSWSRTSPRTASCRWSTSSPAASPPRPTRRSRCSWARRASSSAPASSSPEDPARTASAIVQATTHFDDPQDHRRGLEGPGRADARHRDGDDPGGRAPGGPRLVARGPAGRKWHDATHRAVTP